MKTLPYTKALITSFIAALLTLNSNANAQSLEDYSILPETMSVAPDQTPNILFIVDSSGSMRSDSNGNYVGAHDANSRSASVRRVLRNLFSANAGKLNVGLMSFGGESVERSSTPREVDSCNDYSSCFFDDDGNLSITRWSKVLSGRGSLLQSINALDPINVTKLNTVLATEPQLPTFSGENFYGTRNWGHYSVAGTMFENQILISQSGTPLTGSLESAYRYLVDKSLPDDEIDLLGSDSVTYLSSVDGIAAQCRPDTFVFLVTDGEPTVDNTGSSNPTEDEMPAVTAAAAKLRASGIDTFVFGYAVTEDAALNMDKISQSGAGRDAFISDDETTLQAQIETAINEITISRGSSSGISVVASSSDTAGSVVQAIYNPELSGSETVTNNDGTTTEIEVTVSWTSTLSAYFLDRYGYLREDNATSGTQGKLDGYDIDSAFTLQLEDVDSDGDGVTDTQDVRATRIKPTNFNTNSFTEVVIESNVELSDLDPIWEAGEILGNNYDPADSDAERTTVAKTYAQVNRPYSLPSSDTNGYRRVYTWIQNNPADENFDSGSQIQFLFDSSASPAADTINANNYTLLDAGSAAEAEKVVGFIRGAEGISGYRNRSIAGNAYLLGDIVHSTAAQVDTPAGTFNTRFQDSSYSAFKDAYEFRRRMVYVGSNDGLLHAFNGGFWDGEAAQLNLEAADGSDKVAHALGAEVWAYAPMNLLPHLRFLTDPSYDSTYHVSYVDGPIQAFDVKAFTPSDTHVNGWGTIIVAGMRFGGGDYPDVDHDADGQAGDTFTARSAYVIIDVTDPTEEPKVIGEITHPNLGFTTSTPDIMKEGDDWFLVFGSGPNDLQTATSTAPIGQTRPPQIFKYRLNEGNRGFTSDADGNDPIGSANGFVGDIVSHDWNSDYTDDAVYFGTIEGDLTTPRGAMYRYVSAASSDSGNSETNRLIDTDRPVTTKALLKSSAGNDWVFFGTGRYYTAEDALDENRNAFYGIQEQADYSSVALSSLVDVTGVEVDNQGALSSSVEGQESFVALKNYILNDPDTNGWFVSLPKTTGAPANKNSAPALSFRNLLFYTDYAPPVEDADVCKNEFGESFLSVVDLTTGTANFTADFDGALGTENDILTRRTSIGDGYAYQSYLFVGPDPETGKSRIIIKSPLSTGEIADTPISLPPRPNGRTSWRELEVQ